MAFKLQVYTGNYEISNPSPDLSPEFQAHTVTCLIGLLQRLQDIANLLHTNQIPHFQRAPLGASVFQLMATPSCQLFRPKSLTVLI